MQKYKKLILKLVISSGLFYILLSKIDISLVIGKFGTINLSYVPFVVLFLILNYIVGSLRWKILLIFDEGKDVSVKYLMNLYFVGSFFNNFMPSSIGGDVYKFLRLGKKIGSIAHAFTATFMERFTGVMILFLFALFSFPVVLSDFINFGEYYFKGISVVLALVCFGLFLLGLRLGFWFLGILSRKFSKVKKLYVAISSYKYKKGAVLLALLISVIVQFLSVFTQYFIFLSLGVKLPLVYSLLVFPVISLASFLPISLNGIGIQDSLYVNLMAFAGVSPELSLSASILYHLFRLGVSLVGGVLYAMGKDS